MAFSGSGAASGAAGGAMMGAKLGPWGAAAGGVAGGLMGAFGGKKGTAPVHHQDWLSDPQYGWTKDLLENQAGFYGDELNRIRSGQAPSYWAGLESSIRDQQQGDLDRNYFGRPGERGGSMMDNYMSLGAQTGIGPRGTQAQVTKGLRDYSQERSTIENYISQLRAGEMQNAYNTIPGGINNLSQGPQGQWDIWDSAGTEGSNPGGDLLGLGMQYGSNPFSGFSQGNVAGTGMFGSKFGGQTQSEILGTNTAQYR